MIKSELEDRIIELELIIEESGVEILESNEREDVFNYLKSILVSASKTFQEVSNDNRELAHRIVKARKDIDRICTFLK